LIIFLSSCVAKKDISGTYYSIGKDHTDSLIINKDHSFILMELYFDGTSKCEGKWVYTLKDTVLLKCADAGLDEMLQGGYMSDRTNKIVIIANHQLKFQQKILMRKY